MLRSSPGAHESPTASESGANLHTDTALRKKKHKDSGFGPPERVESRNFRAGKSHTDAYDLTMESDTPIRRLTRDEKNAQTEDRILAAARAVFGARGYDGASMDDVAEQAGLSKGALYYRHSTKEDLFLALLEHEGRRHAAALAELAAETAALATLAAESGGAGAGVRAQRAVDQLVALLSPASGWPPAMPEFVTYAGRSERLGAALGEQGRAARAEIVALMESRARDMGLEFPLAPEQLATVVSALASGLAVERRIDADAVPPELFGTALSLFLSGVAVAARRRA